MTLGFISVVATGYYDSSSSCCTTTVCHSHHTTARCNLNGSQNSLSELIYSDHFFRHRILSLFLTLLSARGDIQFCFIPCSRIDPPLIHQPLCPLAVCAGCGLCRAPTPAWTRKSKTFKWPWASERASDLDDALRRHRAQQFDSRTLLTPFSPVPPFAPFQFTAVFQGGG